MISHEPETVSRAKYQNMLWVFGIWELEARDNGWLYNADCPGFVSSPISSEVWHWKGVAICDSAQENHAIGRNNTYIWCITYISDRRRARKGIEESIRLLRHHESEVSILSGLGCSLVHVLSLNCKETGKMNSFPSKPQRTRSRMKSGPEIKM